MSICGCRRESLSPQFTTFHNTCKCNWLCSGAFYIKQWPPAVHTAGVHCCVCMEKTSSASAVLPSSPSFSMQILEIYTVNIFGIGATTTSNQYFLKKLFASVIRNQMDLTLPSPPIIILSTIFFGQRKHSKLPCSST